MPASGPALPEINGGPRIPSCLGQSQSTGQWRVLPIATSSRDSPCLGRQMSNKLYNQVGNAAKRALEHQPANDENGK